ncbi:MAG: SPOR domain-containing protein [Deltaproteobacteria bacterium]|jgi:hypothetical protein|nr:SPOR domain-containing protein [Deltaproteobacteria bacterium]
MSQSLPPVPLPLAPPPPVAGARKPDPKAPLGKRAYTFSLTFSKLLTAVIVGLIGVGWIFLLGVMVGRGYNPEDKLNELTGRVLRGRQTPVVQDPPQAILQPEDLSFGAALRDKPLHNGTAVVYTPAPPPDPPTNGAATAGAPVAPPAPTTAPPPTTTPPPPVRPAPQTTPPSAQPARFDVVYQVAAFRVADQADRQRELLEGEGVRTNLEKSVAKDGKSLYKVLVVRRGTAEDEKQLLAVLERLKLGAPLLRSRKPVGGGGAR